MLKASIAALLPVYGRYGRRMNPSMELGSAIHGSHTPVTAIHGEKRYPVGLSCPE